MYASDTSKKPVPGDWHRADIKAALEKKGFSIRGFARANRYAPSSVSQAFRIPYPRMEALIAAAIGVPVTDIWPSRYDENGEPKRGRAVVNSTDPGRGRNVRRTRPS